MPIASVVRPIAETRLPADPTSPGCAVHCIKLTVSHQSVWTGRKVNARVLGAETKVIDSTGLVRSSDHLTGSSQIPRWTIQPMLKDFGIHTIPLLHVAPTGVAECTTYDLQIDRRRPNGVLHAEPDQEHPVR